MINLIGILFFALLVTKPLLAADDCGNLPSVSPPRLRANAYVMIEKLQKEVEYKLQENRQDFDSSELENVLETVNCIRSKVYETPISCKPDPDIKYKKDRFMYIVSNWGIYEKKIHYEEYTSQFSPKYQAGLLIHELSHLCGTEDHEYATGNDSAPFIKGNWQQEAPEPSPHVIAKQYLPTDLLSRADVPWIENADHYRVWSLFGFCVPGEDCRNHFIKYKKDAGY